MLRREIRNYPSHIFLSSKMGVLNVQRCKHIDSDKKKRFDNAILNLFIEILIL